MAVQCGANSISAPAPSVQPALVWDSVTPKVVARSSPKARPPVPKNKTLSITGAAANRTEPGIGEFPWRKGFFGAGRLDVAFDTEYPRPVPPIVAGLNAAHETGRLGRIVGDRAPGIAQVAAEIGAGPAKGVVQLIAGIGRVYVVEVCRSC